MKARRSVAAGTTSEGRGAWPVFLLVLGVTLVPAACELWFMSQAVRNERLVVRQKLEDLYLHLTAELPS